MQTILEANNVMKKFKMKKENLFEKQGYFTAVNNISLKINKAQTIGIVGESGSGKSTVSEIIGDLQRPSSGTIEYYGKNIRALNKREYKEFRKNVQFIFQSPKDSLHPFYTIKENLLEPLKIFSEDYHDEQAINVIKDMIKRVGLDETILKKHASEISGGQAQRVAIARALLLKPKIIVCDECVSALDVSVQAQILNLLKDLQEEFQTSYLFISHDIGVVNNIADYVIVMKNGEVVEEGSKDQVLFSPRESYTETLIASSFLQEEGEEDEL